jgi:Rps23 Pro-64 3,4-dihydroxylase Tpa1-like proline 4-hydroxylase
MPTKKSQRSSVQVENWLDLDFLRDTKTPARLYGTQQPYPHAAIENFLNPKKAKLLEKALRTHRFERKESDLFTFWQTTDLRDSDNPVIKEFLAVMASDEVREWLKAITGIRVKSLDAMGVIYRDTDRLLCHDDELEDRKIAYILNLSDGFTNNDGGALAILDSDTKGRPKSVVRRIMPKHNTFAFFTVSKKSHHVVEEVLAPKDRLTIGGWFH